MIVKNATQLARLVRLFLVAFAPLMLILAIQTFNDFCTGGTRTWVFWITAVWSVIGLLDGWWLPRGALKKGSIKAVFYDIQDQSGAVAAYLATYLLPFIGIEFSTIQEVLALVVYFLIVLMIFLQSDLAAINPTLYIFGWRIVHARVRFPNNSNMKVVVLTKRQSQLSPEESVSVVRFGKFFVLKEV